MQNWSAILKQDATDWALLVLAILYSVVAIVDVMRLVLGYEEADLRGLAYDGVFISISITFFVLLRSNHRQARRLRNGQCLSCGYDLRALESGYCPECGEAIPNLDMPEE